ncbi:MAG: hypothetical protein IKM29_02710 [Clostridia bacterium]|nr:hypothetical protein [Clostridia bacterium]
MKTISKIRSVSFLAAVILAIFVSLLPANAENSTPALKDFAKNAYPGAAVVFSFEDIKNNTVSKKQPSALLIAGLPRSDVGLLMLGNKILSEGNIFSAKEMELLSFVPKTEADFSAEISLVPLNSEQDFARGGKPFTVTLNFSKHPNSPPVAAGLRLKTYENMPIEINFSAYDHDGDVLSYSVVSQKGNGNLTLVEDRIVFTPKENSLGDFSLQFYAKDSCGNTSELTEIFVDVSENRSGFRYVDISDPTKEYYAVRLAEDKIFRGECYGENNLILSSEPFSKTEFAVLCASALDLAREADAEISSVGIPAWQSPFIETAVAAGAFDGTDLSSPVTLSSAAYMILDLAEDKFGCEISSDSLKFTADSGIIPNRFSPDKILSREEALEIIYKTMDVFERKSPSELIP